jgi:3-oxoacyl-[acyl-carrier protein] reductase
MNKKIALVTGASRGIGAAIASQLGKDGMYVIGTATAEKGTDVIAESFSKQSIEGMSAILDLGSIDSIKALAKSLEGQSPGILVNNAGITRDNLSIRMKPEEWDEVIKTNLSGIFYMTQSFLKTMIKERYGRIINITSVVGFTGNPGQANYASAKAGIVGFSKSLAREVGSRGVTVNCVAPGFIDTDMTRILADTQKAQIMDQIPLQRLGEASEVAKTVSFLASDDANYITGETIHVNGGMHM